MQETCEGTALEGEANPADGAFAVGVSAACYFWRMSRTVYYAAVSADGFIAATDGSVGWLDPFNCPELGYEAFLAKVGAVVLGRATYEQTLTFGPWPYSGRLGLIVTTRPLAGLPEEVRAVTEAELPASLAAMQSQVRGDVWVVGGGMTARACLDGDFIDELELYVIPRLLGDGIPLFARRNAIVALELLQTLQFHNGVVKLRYRVERRRFGDAQTAPGT